MPSRYLTPHALPVIPYRIFIDGRWVEQTKMFNRSDMSFYGFSTADVRPPEGFKIVFLRDGEPELIPEDEELEPGLS